jgi:hypothetical protein
VRKWPLLCSRKTYKEETFVSWLHENKDLSFFAPAEKKLLSSWLPRISKLFQQTGVHLHPPLFFLFFP